MLSCVALVRTNVLEECIASIIKVTRIGELWPTLAVTSNRSMLCQFLQEPHCVTPQKWKISWVRNQWYCVPEDFPANVEVTNMWGLLDHVGVTTSGNFQLMLVSPIRGVYLITSGWPVCGCLYRCARGHPRKCIVKPFKGWFSRSGRGKAAVRLFGSCLRYSQSWLAALPLERLLELLAALHWGPLNEACSSVELNESREWIRVIPT
jgi:hypothetical protein